MVWMPSFVLFSNYRHSSFCNHIFFVSQVLLKIHTFLILRLGGTPLAFFEHINALKPKAVVLIEATGGYKSSSINMAYFFFQGTLP